MKRRLRKKTFVKLCYLTLAFLIMIQIVSLVSAGDFFGMFKQGTSIELTQVCTNETDFCDSCTISSVTYPDATIIVSDEVMTKRTSDFNYTLLPNQTTELGTYTVKGYCYAGTLVNPFIYELTVANSSREFSLGDILVYSFFLLFCLLVLYFSSRLVMDNSLSKDPLMNSKLYEVKKTNEFLYYVNILKTKLWVVGIFGIYLSLLLFLVLLNQLVYNLGFMDLNTILQPIILIISWGLVPFVIFWIGYLIITFYLTTTKVMEYQFGGFRR
jgi:hypothetical protein